jgi:hypothetical protein
MIPYSLLTITVLIALAGFLILRQAVEERPATGWHRLLLCVAIAIFLYLYGAWVFGSIFLKYIYAVCFVTLFTWGVGRRQYGLYKSTKAGKIVNIFFSLILFTLSILYFTGTTGKPYGIARLTLPFKYGLYFVLQGGKGLPTNIFHYGLNGAVYAMDIAKLNAYGNRASGISSSLLKDYEIFNDTVYSPCNGLIKESADNNLDNIPPSRKRGPTNINHVLIETDSMYVFMGHFKYQCVFVKEGQVVQTGQPLALAGNSGFSVEPHLHIQAHAKTNTGLSWYEEHPLWIEFDGKGYLLFETIAAANLRKMQ